MFEESNPFISPDAGELGELNDAVPGERLEGEANARIGNSSVARQPLRGGPAPAVRVGVRSPRGPMVLKRMGLTEHYVPPWDVLQAAEASQARPKAVDRKPLPSRKSGELPRRVR